MMADRLLSPIRLLMLRGAYAIIVLGLGITLWPQLIEPVQDWPLKSGVVASMLAALSLLSLIGLWRPIAMLPILLFEVLWKAIWLARMALPLWFNGSVDQATAMTIFECAFAIPVVLLMPWDLIWQRYARPRRGGSTAAEPQPALPWERGS
jgi:hypothetical protein